MLKIRRDPIFKSKDTQEDGATSGRDTVGTPHTRSRIGWRLFFLTKLLIEKQKTNNLRERKRNRIGK